MTTLKTRMGSNTYIVQSLIAAALADGYTLSNLDPAKVKVVEKHKRRVTVTVRKADNRGCIAGDPFKCQYAVKLSDLPGYYSAFVGRRISYTLGKTGKGYTVFKFGTPDMARIRTILFDLGQPMDKHTTTFTPLSKARQSQARNAAARASKKRRASGLRRRTTANGTTPMSFLRASRTAAYAA